MGGTDKLFKFKIDAPGTVNQVSAISFTPDSNKGVAFRVTKGEISVPAMDAIADGDKVEFQITRVEDQSTGTALYEINSEHEVYTHAIEYNVLGTNGSITKEDVRKCHPLPRDEIDGVLLKSGMKHYFHQFITGQDGALPMYLKLWGKYVQEVDDKDLNNWNVNYA